jgi:hypothetical protein
VLAGWSPTSSEATRKRIPGCSRTRRNVRIVQDATALNDQIDHQAIACMKRTVTTHVA